MEKDKLLQFLEFMLNDFEFLFSVNKDLLKKLVECLEMDILHGAKKIGKKDAADLEAIIL
jgi:hypothetical protein